MRTFAIVTAFVGMLATPALANQYPQQMAALDQHLQQHGSMLKPDQLAKVKQLRAKAEADHKAGRHDQSLQDIRHAYQAMGM